MGRPFEHFDWETWCCGWKGHVTYRPDDEALAERISARTAVGEAWRCLRCTEFVVGAPQGGGSTADAPSVRRGGALRDAFVLRALAVERGFRSLLILALAFAVHSFDGARGSLQRLFDEYLPRLRLVGEALGVNLEEALPVHLVQRALDTSQAKLEWVTIALLAYGVLELAEGVGLWLMRRWGEYLTVVGTGVFIPVEVYELTHGVTALRLAVFALNAFAVGYILWTKRLFGIRGGRAVLDAERHSASLLALESAALARDAE